MNDLNCLMETEIIFQYGKAWMMKQIKECFACGNSSGLSVDELCDSLTQLLTSSRTNDELQNEVFILVIIIIIYYIIILIGVNVIIFLYAFKLFNFLSFFFSCLTFWDLTILS